MKLRETIKLGKKFAQTNHQREMWTAIGLLEKRTRHTHAPEIRIPPFEDDRLEHDGEETKVTPGEYIVVPRNTLEFCKTMELREKLWDLFYKLKNRSEFDYNDRCVVLDAIDVVRAIEETDE